MKRNRFIAVFLIFISLFAVSCNITHNSEGAVEAVVALPSRVLRGVQGQNFGIPAGTTYTNKGYHFTIKLTKGSFAAFADGASAPLTVEPQIPGLSYTVYGAVANGAASMLVQVSGTVDTNATVGEFPIKITIPGSAFSPTHYSDVEVTVPDSFKFDILDKNEPYAIMYPSDMGNRDLWYKVDGNVPQFSSIVDTTNATVNPSNRASVVLLNDIYDISKISAGSDVSNWLNTPTSSLHLYIHTTGETLSITNAPVKFGYKPDGTASIKPFYYDNMVVPSEYVKSGKNVKVINLFYGSARILDSSYSAFIESKTENANTGSQFSTIVTFNLDGSFVRTALAKDADMTSFIVSGAVPGLSYRAVGSAVNDTRIQMYITGTPSQSGTYETQFNIPANQIDVTTVSSEYGSSSTSSNTLLPVSGTLTINVEAGDFYDYALYDLASFGTVEASLLTISPNAGLTTDKEGNALVYETGDRYILKSGKVYQKLPPTITYEPGLKRRGYILKGFSRRLPGDATVDTSRIDYPISDPNGPISFTLNASEKGNSIKLYAIWEVDPEAWGWTKKPDGSYQKTQDISEGGKYLPATFDVEKAYPNTTDDSGATVDNSELRSHYEDYPYYREAKILAKGLYVPGVNTTTTTHYNDLDDVQLTSDFAIGEQVITGYMLDVLRDWNTTGSKGYDIPTEFTNTTSAPSGTPTASTNQVGYGARYESSNYRVNNEKSEPITFLTVSQSIVIANAMSAYYNDKKGLTLASEDYLDPAYVSADGAEIKTLTAADAIVSALTTSDVGKALAKEGAKGFRLPTAEEWGLAARIVPESSYLTALTGVHTTETGASTRNYLYPQLTRSNMWSGDTALASGDSQNTLADKYVWYAFNSSVVGENLGASHGFLKSAIENKVSYPGTVLEKLPNKIGVYGMSGNMWERCDQIVVSGSNLYFRLRGGSFGSNASNTRVGYLGNSAASNRYGIGGLRLARLVQ